MTNQHQRVPAVSADLIVVGSGAAGLSAALKAAELGARVVVLTAGSPLAGSSPRAQGGVAAALGADDSPALHAADTLAVGGGLNDRAAVAVLTAEGEPSLNRLITRGVPFDRDLGLEAGHARRRILHAGGAATGHILSSALLEQVSTQPSITLFAQTRADALLKRDGRVVGVRSGVRTFHAPATLLATGGYAALWGRTTNAPENRGTGLMLAYQAGASLADLEFVQFHPTALSLPGHPAFLLSEALRGEGALLLDTSGREVVDPLLPRDVVARALHRHLRAHGPVFLSLRHLDAARVRQRFPSLVQRLDEFGLDLARDPLPVAPAAHYCMGGIRTDTWGRTDVPGLLAAGEVACTGAQGANRLASNSLLECLVFGARAAEAALLPPADEGTHERADRASDVANQAADLVERAAERAERTSDHADSAGLAERAGDLAERAGDLAERNADPGDRAGDVAKFRADCAEFRAHLAECIADLGERAGDFAERAARRAERSAERGTPDRDAAPRRELPADASSPSWRTRGLPEFAPLRLAARDRVAVMDSSALGALLDADLGVERSAERLGRLVAALPSPPMPENSSHTLAQTLAHIADPSPSADPSPDVLLAGLIAQAAFLRQESRGAHFRTDRPDTSPAWRGRIHFRAGSAPRFEEVQPQ